MSSVNYISGGLDVTSLVDNLIYVEREPARRIEKRTKTYQDKVSAYQKFNTKLLAMKTSLESLLYSNGTVPLTPPTSFSTRQKSSLFAARTATSGNQDVLTATGGSGVVTGNFTVTVSNLATFNSFASSNLASDTTTLTQTGSLVIQKGSAQPVTVTIDSTNNTLQGIKNAINNKNMGVTASVINDGSATPYKLIITGNNSGTTNALTITNNLTQGTDATVSLTEKVVAEDASLSVNGVTITKSSNTITDAIEGVTLNLKSKSATPVSVLVERDTDSIVKGIQDLVSKYNDIQSYISSQFKYDATKKTAGLLAGDFTLRDAQSRLSKTFSGRIDSDSAGLQLLSQVGVKIANDGTLSVDETKLRNAINSNFNDTTHLFLADALDSGGASISVGPRLWSQLKSLTDPIDGSVFHAQDAVQKTINDQTKQVKHIDDRLAIRKDILTAEYSRADIALRKLTGLQSSLNTQIASIRSF